MSHKSATSTPVSTIGIDLGKNSFHLVGLDQRGAIVLQLKCSRAQLEPVNAVDRSYAAAKIRWQTSENMRFAHCYSGK